MKYDGFYINLDRNPERHAEMETQLANLNIAAGYRRFPAIEGNAHNYPNPNLKPGEIGAFASHADLLKDNLTATRPLHVVEDDVLFAACMEQTIDWVIDKQFFENYDIIYTDLFIPTSNAYYKSYKNLFDRTTVRNEQGRVREVTFQLVDLRDKKFGTASSLLIAPKAVARLHDLYMAELTRGPQVPIDIFVWQQCMMGHIKAACLFPFVTSLRLEHSITTTIGDRYDQLSVLARDIVRASFFVDRDLEACRAYANKFLGLPEDPHLQLLLQVLGFSFTDKFVDI